MWKSYLRTKILFQNSDPLGQTLLKQIETTFFITLDEPILDFLLVSHWIPSRSGSRTDNGSPLWTIIHSRPYFFRTPLCGLTSSVSLDDKQTKGFVPCPIENWLFFTCLELLSREQIRIDQQKMTDLNVWSHPSLPFLSRLFHYSVWIAMSWFLTSSYRLS